MGTGSNKRQAVLTLAAAAVAGQLLGTAQAGVTGGSGQEYIISTSGATALSAFTRGGDGSTLNRGPYSLGVNTLTIGTSTYTLDGNGQRLGRALRNSPLSNEPPLTADRFVYTYHEIGSVNGVNDVAQDGGLLPVNADLDLITSGNPYWHMGTRLQANPANGTTLANGYAWQGKQPVRIAWSDVRAEQAFSIPGGNVSAGARPTQPGYGRGRDLPAGGTNYQALTSAGNLVGGLDPATTRLRNEDVAVVPFTLSANPGTGLSRVSEDDAKWLQATGRLANGANFNSVTRDAGSGTRNQKANNLKLDPSWASGERDRRNSDGTEKNPFTFNNNDDRPSAGVSFADKTSGSSRVKPLVQFTRMSLGVLSSGDAGGDGRNAGSIAPIRVLAIDWDDAGEPAGAVGSFVQPTLENVVSGKYQMWSAAQAVTVTPDGTTAATEASKIKGDQDDDGTGTGVHRKFLNNIRQSVANFGNADTNQTPFDAIGAASFIPTAIMSVSKTFDGDVQQARTRTAAEENAYQEFLAGSSLKSNLAWADPATQNGDLANAGLRYNIFAPGNNVIARDQPTANANSNLSIDIEPRTNLAGDFDGDQVRDLKDVEALAMAYAATGSYLATPQSGAHTTNARGVARNYNGAEVASVESATTTPRVAETLAYTAGQEGLTVLSDLNGNGNVTPNGLVNGTVASIERADVRYFLYGASVDTSAHATPAAKMADGVRTGQLRKNEAVIRFNAELDDLAADGIISTTVANGAKFDRFDVNNDGVVNREDAKYVDRNVGKNFTDLTDVLSTWDDLVAAELNDNNLITHVDPNAAASFNGTAASLGNDSDFQQVRAALGGLLLNGDANFDGSVSFADFSVLQNFFGQSVDRWSKADFNFDGQVTFADFSLLQNNFGLTAGGGLASISDAEMAQFEAFAAAVPEPGTVSLLAGSLLCLATRRRRRPTH